MVAISSLRAAIRCYRQGDLGDAAAFKAAADTAVYGFLCPKPSLMQSNITLLALPLG
jgi:hypothetical protein